MLKSLILSLFVALLCTACATSVNKENVANTGATAGVTFQQAALTPKTGGKLVAATELNPGDIILSASDGLTSAGIRLLTLAPVSHAALYIGNQQIAEAVGEGVRVRTVSEVLDEEAVVVAFRHPDLQDQHASLIRSFALQQVGDRYNYVGVMLQAPFSIERRICELPLVPAGVRDFCLRGMATIQLGAGNNDRFFCSQFVLEAYRAAGLPITDGDPRWVSPADILHMREGDVPSMKIRQTLVYVGHLKFQPAPLQEARRMAAVTP
ncbi:YaeF family permuted papain-like enzyme [Andreprevotia chitinilytica]|uniref:YaeF family permuted papain-like enzyme n=1 Tax=Andreprevotia chitinilytica TaxID=396808 RepID=UPI000690BE06|nr:YaeF family permuted papain-like enzyme [Andreprevotia chitinilytica]